MTAPGGFRPSFLGSLAVLAAGPAFAGCARERAVLSDGMLVSAVAFSADGRLVAAVGRTGYDDQQLAEVRVFATGSGQRLARIELGRCDHNYKQAAFFADGRRLMVRTGPVLVLEWETGRALLSVPPQPNSEWIAATQSADGSLIAAVEVAGRESGVVLLNARDGSAVRRMEGPAWATSPGVFSPDGGLFALDSQDGVLLWETATGRRRTVPRGVRGNGGGVAFLPDGRLLVGDTVWTVEGWSESLRLEGGRPAFPAVCPAGPALAGIAVDGRGLVSLLNRNDVFKQTSLFFWDLRTGRQTGWWPDAFQPSAFSPDGRFFATAVAGRGLVLYEMPR